jgi:hypothetical protein
MTRKDIINEVEKTLDVRYAWSKSYDNGTMLTEYTLYYNRRARKPLAWLQIGFRTDNDEVMGADIVFNINGERREMEIEIIEDISEIVKQIVGFKNNYYF